MSDEEFTLEKFKLNERLQKVELQIARLVAHMESEQGTFARIELRQNENTDRLTKILDRHDLILIGDGTSPGIIMRLDRIEQISETRKSHLAVMWLAVATAFATALTDVAMRIKTFFR